MLERHDFQTRDELATVFAATLAADINTAIADTGSALIAVSGGSTPKKLFARLGRHRDISWEKVSITLVDERWVPETSDRSNARLVNEQLLQGPAATAHFLPLYSGGTEPDAAAIARTNSLLAEFPDKFAAVIVGMGNDGHTASFFPGGDTLEEALTGAGPALAIRAPDAGEARVTLVFKRLMETQKLYLHIEGDEKAQTLEKALQAGPVEEMPIRSFLRQPALPLQIYWAP